MSHVVSHSQACDALDTVLTYLQQQAHVPESTTVTINSLLIETNKKRYNNLKQTNLVNILTNNKNMLCYVILYLHSILLKVIT